jgi:serine/threonine-protein kinase
MAPEQLRGHVTRQTDVYAAGIVLWETLACQRLFAGATEAEMLERVLHGEVDPPSEHNPDVPPELDRVVLKALERNPAYRYWTAREMAQEIDECIRPASAMQIAEWMETTVGPTLAARAALVAGIESGTSAPMVAFPGSGMPELRSSSVVSHTLPSTPPKAAPFQRSRALLVGGLIASVAMGVVAAVAFRMGASATRGEATAPPIAPATAPATVAAEAPKPVVTAAPLGGAPTPGVNEVTTVGRPAQPATPAPDAGGTPAPLPAATDRDTPPAPTAVRHDGRAKPRPRPGATAAPASTVDINSLLDTH